MDNDKGIAGDVIVDVDSGSSVDSMVVVDSGTPGTTIEDEGVDDMGTVTVGEVEIVSKTFGMFLSESAIACKIYTTTIQSSNISISGMSQ